MSTKLANFIDRYPHMFAEYRTFAVKAIRDSDAKLAARASRAAKAQV